MNILATIFKFNTPNANGFIYDTESLKQAVEVFNKTPKYAIAGEYPPKQITHELTDVDNIVGPVTLSIDGEYVVASIDTHQNGKGLKAADMINSCTERLKILPISTCTDETVTTDTNLHIMYISHIICTCADLDFGDIEEDMFIAFPADE